VDRDRRMVRSFGGEAHRALIGILMPEGRDLPQRNAAASRPCRAA
jgi:hypothetical protein